MVKGSLLRADCCFVLPTGVVGRTGDTDLLPKLITCVLSYSWAFGSNSLPIAGSVGMGVARRTQRQFPMPPRALPPGRMGLLSPSGIGGVSPRHALNSPSLGGQGRQVSQLLPQVQVLLGLGWQYLGCVFGPGLLFTLTLSSPVLRRTCGLPILEAATACPARAAALYSALTRSQFTRHPRLFSCSLQVRCLASVIQSGQPP